MKRIPALLLLLASLAFAQETPSNPNPGLSPAERGMAEARSAIAKKPDQYAGYNQLAIALLRRAREISEVSYYAKAEEPLQKSFALAPGNYDGEKIRVLLLLGAHEFAAALEAAKVLNQKTPDDVLVYGLFTDAQVGLGNYADAELAANWMLKLRPGNVPALTRAAYLRELFGDVDGAQELLNMAYQSTSPSEVEDGAWILTQVAHLKFESGKTEEAEQLLNQALTLFPNYYYALGNLAKVRIQQKRTHEAVSLLRQRYVAAPHAKSLYDLAEALDLDGKTAEARAAFAEFETKSLAENNRADNSNLELVFYYADHAHDSAKALEVALKEFGKRHDVYTLDAYAWALHRNGRDAEARKQIETALAVGVCDATLFRHAGEIALRTVDRDGAESYLRRSADLNSLGSEQARVLLSALASSPSRP